MRSFTRIVLPILLVAGVVFGITFIQVYSPEEERNEPAGPGPSSKPGTQGLPLKFGVFRAAAPREERNEQGPLPLPAHLLHLKYWNPDLEVGAAGHYDFWCQNRHPTPVSVRVPAVNCQCAGVELAVVPPDAFRDYAVGSALAGGPFCPAPGPVAALAQVALNRRLTWEHLYRDGDQVERVVPGAEPAAATQFALVRLGWTGKAIGPKGISAEVYFNLQGNPTPAHQQLSADINVVPAFDIVRRDGPTRWWPARDAQVGDLREDAVATQEFYLYSSTRAHPVYSVAGDATDPCVTWTAPVPASREEWNSLLDFVSRIDDREKQIRPPKSLYKVQVNVRERAKVPGTDESRQLDLGPLERRLTVSAADGGSVPVAIRGRVFGEVTILTGADTGKVDLGNSFPADQDRTKYVVLLADRTGLDLKLLDAETTPNFLKVKLEPLEPRPDGRKQWKLQVTVPKGSLYGALPPNSAVILQTNTPRRFRLPVVGMTYDSGGPRL
ncbi:MAG TPA: hypothetical protein VKD90_00925 [Gemmataceae bacterium]|nr:hypothetical protein [Gemmataceae bacterium]